jgi:hypothetical protein
MCVACSWITEFSIDWRDVEFNRQGRLGDEWRNDFDAVSATSATSAPTSSIVIASYPSHGDCAEAFELRPACRRVERR